VGDSDSGPKTSASDMAVFLERLYNGKFANSSNTTKMINLLKNQQVKTKLAKYLPKNAVIAHKTGELGSFSHDVGIVYLSNGNYIIAVLSNTSNQLDANEKIAQLSKKVYDYFSSK
jgi:beta-lactamase class A